MSWITSQTLGRSTHPDFATVAVYRNAQGVLYGLVRASRRLVAAAGLKGAERVDVLFGVGDDFGKLLIRQGDRCRVHRPFHVYGFTLPLGVVLYDAEGRGYRLIAATRSATRVEAEVTDGGLAFRLPPEWFAAEGDDARKGG